MKTAAQYRKARARRQFWREVKQCEGLIFVNLILLGVAVMAFAIVFGPHF